MLIVTIGMTIFLYSMVLRYVLKNIGKGNRNKSPQVLNSTSTLQQKYQVVQQIR